MTKLDELVSFILSDKLTAIRNFNCYDELVAEAKKLQLEQAKTNTESENLTNSEVNIPLIPCGFKKCLVDIEGEKCAVFVNIITIGINLD